MLRTLSTDTSYTFIDIYNFAPAQSEGRLMKRLVLKGKEKMWPTVTWLDKQLVVYYLGEDDNDVNIRETRGIDFEELFLHLDNRGSVFITMKPAQELWKSL